MAATYRRAGGRQEQTHDYSLESLLECYAHESLGHKYSITFRKDTKTNGYIYGKWQRDICVASWRESILAGEFCKAEFISPLNRWWAESALASLVVPTFFPYNKKEYGENATNVDVISVVNKCTTNSDILYTYRSVNTF